MHEIYKIKTTTPLKYTNTTKYLKNITEEKNTNIITTIKKTKNKTLNK